MVTIALNFKTQCDKQLLSYCIYKQKLIESDDDGILKIPASK